MIHTEQSIEIEVSQISGTHIKRNNLRKKLKNKSNEIVSGRIDLIKNEIRSLKSSGVRQQKLAPIYAKITALELMVMT